MSSVFRFTREPTALSSRFTVWPYRGSSDSEYYFTVDGDSLYRIEADLSGNGQWVVARDMGKETFINTIDTNLIQMWQDLNSWTDITVIRKGRARKFQLLAIPRGNITASGNNGPAWNAAAYTDPTGNIDSIYYYQYTGINDPLITGNASTTINNNTNQNLPFGTFWAVVDPVFIQYTYDGEVYTRAIVNRVNPS